MPLTKRSRKNTSRTILHDFEDPALFVNAHNALRCALADENAMDAEVIIAGLRARGLDILTAAEAGMLKRDDEDQLAVASARFHALYSFNIGHFFHLHIQWSTTGRDHAGVILGYSPREQIRRLSSLFETLSAEEMRNRVEFLSGW